MRLQEAKTATGIAAGRASAILVLLMICGSGISQTQAPPTSGATPAVHICQLSPIKGAWKGSCGHLFRESPGLTIAPAKAITTGVWRKGVNPTAVWAGDLNYSDGPDQIEIEIYARGSGVLRTTDGWFPISK